MKTKASSDPATFKSPFTENHRKPSEPCGDCLRRSHASMVPSSRQGPCFTGPSILSVAAQRAFVASLRELPTAAKLGAASDPPALRELLADARWLQAPAKSLPTAACWRVPLELLRPVPCSLLALKPGLPSRSLKKICAGRLPEHVITGVGGRCHVYIIRKAPKTDQKQRLLARLGVITNVAIAS